MFASPFLGAQVEGQLFRTCAWELEFCPAAVTVLDVKDTATLDAK